MKDLIKKSIKLYETYTGSKPSEIRLGSLDYHVYKNSKDYDTTVDDVIIKKDFTEVEGIYIISETTEQLPYAIMIDEIINFENRKGIAPNFVSISKFFYDDYQDVLSVEDQVFNTIFNCIIEINPDQVDDVVCMHKDSLVSDIENYHDIINTLYINNDYDNSDYEDMVCNLYDLHPYFDEKEEEETIKQVSKKEYIDWLLNDDDALVEALIYVEDHEDEMDDAFDYFTKECKFERWLKSREDHKDEGDDDYYGYY